MRKKELLKLNGELFDRIERAKIAIDELKKENAQLKSQIEKLENEKQALHTQKTATEPMKALEQKIITHASVSEDTGYGAAVIGKIVVRAAQLCNTLTSSHSGGNTKELVNLILGRTEVAKAEILRAVSSDMDIDGKKDRINSEQEATEDYFQSVMAQIE